MKKLDENTIKHLYLQEKLSIQEIAKQLHCCKKRVKQRMLEWGIPIRVRSPRQNIHCRHCDAITLNPVFCSRSCAAAHNNKCKPKRKPSGKCVSCGDPIRSKYTYCKNCFPLSSLLHKTYGELCSLRKYQKHSAIRDHARKRFLASDLPKKCIICGYSKHIDVCHIKAIRQFSDATQLSEINSLLNLMPLCKNHHWEFDNNMMSKQDLAVIDDFNSSRRSRTLQAMLEASPPESAGGAV